MSLQSFLAWAGVAEAGSHIDVMKEGKLINKIMIDQKNHYIFGRNPDLNEFCLNHASCSRQHAALIYHKHLKRFFLVDLESRYGTFIGKLKLEPNKPTQIQPDTQFSFGESTRYFILREKPVQLQISKNADGSKEGETCETLPVNETELNNLTEFNTAHNKRISMLRVGDTEATQRGSKRKNKSVNFRDEEEIINLEDIDDTVGKFRNLVQSSVVVPNKRFKPDHSLAASTSTSSDSSARNFLFDQKSQNSFLSDSLSLKLNFNLPNSAPAVNFNINDTVNTADKSLIFATSIEPAYRPGEKKKVYAKEAWPGREKQPF